MVQPTFTQQHILNYSYIDNRGIARPSALFEFMQDAATEHAVLLGLDKDALGVLWVLSRMKVHLSRPLFAGETIRLDTACDGIKGVSWCRSFRFFVGEEAVGGATSTWVTLSPESHRIVRPGSLEEARSYPLIDASFDIPGKLMFPATHPHHVHTVRYSDLDINNHLNNAKTVDLISDALDLEGKCGQYVSHLQVNYTAECRSGEDITLSAGQAASGEIYIRGAFGDTAKFEAQAILSPYEERKG